MMAVERKRVYVYSDCQYLNLLPNMVVVVVVVHVAISSILIVGVAVVLRGHYIEYSQLYLLLYYVPGDDEVGTVVVYIPVLVGTGGTVLVVSCGSISIVVVMAGLGHVTLSPRGPSQPLNLHTLATISIQPLNTSSSPFVKLCISVGLVSLSQSNMYSISSSTIN